MEQGVLTADRCGIDPAMFGAIQSGIDLEMTSAQARRRMTVALKPHWWVQQVCNKGRPSQGNA